MAGTSRTLGNSVEHYPKCVELMSVVEKEKPFLVVDYTSIKTSYLIIACNFSYVVPRSCYHIDRGSLLENLVHKNIEAQMT